MKSKSYVSSCRLYKALHVSRFLLRMTLRVFLTFCVLRGIAVTAAVDADPDTTTNVWYTHCADTVPVAASLTEEMTLGWVHIKLGT